MSYEETSTKIESTLARIFDYNNTIKQKVSLINEEIRVEAEFLKQDVELRVSTIETQAVRLTSQLALNAQYHINRAYFHASPGLVAIFMGIVKVVGVVVSVIKTIVQSKIFQVILNLHKIAYNIWPEYKKAIDNGLKSISNYSKQIGLGIDGLQHLVNAVTNSYGVVAGIAGWEKDDLRGQYYERVTKVMTTISTAAQSYAYDPVKMLENMCYYYADQDQYTVNKRFGEITGSIESLVETTQDSLIQIGYVTSELSQFAANLPQFIKENIPKNILDSISWADNTINNNLLPAVKEINNKINTIDNIIDEYGDKLSNLTENIKNPGYMLLGVDNLPDYAKQNQLDAIDDVTSREFQKQVDEDNETVAVTVQQLESIKEAMSVPTPEPEFLDIESPQRQAMSGIDAEPHETWFVGDF